MRGQCESFYAMMKTPELEQAIGKRLRVHFAMSPQVCLRCQQDDITQESG